MLRLEAIDGDCAPRVCDGTGIPVRPSRLRV